MVHSRLQRLRERAQPDLLRLPAASRPGPWVLLYTGQSRKLTDADGPLIIDADRNFQLSVPPYVCGAIGLYLFALSSDHRCVTPTQLHASHTNPAIPEKSEATTS